MHLLQGQHAINRFFAAAEVILTGGHNGTRKTLYDSLPPESVRSRTELWRRTSTMALPATSTGSPSRNTFVARNARELRATQFLSRVFLHVSSFDQRLMDAFEKHWTVKELAAIWPLSSDSIRRLFQDEPGVAFMGHSDTRKKRKYRTMLIPGSVVKRVHERMVDRPYRDC